MNGRSQIMLPSCLKSRICWSIGEAERLKGSAAHTAEVVVVFYHNYTRMIFYGFLAAFL